MVCLSSRLFTFSRISSKKVLKQTENLREAITHKHNHNDIFYCPQYYSQLHHII
jgi:hypothetical protein